MLAGFDLAAGLAALASLAWAWSRRRRWERQAEALRAAVQDGTPVPAETRLPAALAETLQACASARDRLAETARRTEENLQAVLAAMDEGVLLVDRQHVIRRANPALQSLFALKASPVGQTVLETFRLPALEELVNRVLAERVPQQAELSATLRPGQSATHFTASATPLQGNDGIFGSIVVVHDVSRLRRLEDLRREFVANVSHELRTPLSIFHGHLEILLEQEEYPPESVRPTLEVMRKHSLRLNTLVEDLLTLTRLESKRDRLQPERIVLADFLREALREWQPRVSGKKIQLVSEVQPGLPPLWADSFRLRQVLDNLLDNALKYTPAEGTIRVQARVAEGQIELRVEDSGAGIPPADLPHIFERFYRADKARSREMGGTGLGLSIVKHIIRSHGGTVTAESTYGKGTAVIIHFPVKGEE